MSTNPNPINRKGERNPLCPLYRRCLDLAVSKSWNYWDCRECRLKGASEMEFNFSRTSDGAIAYYDLPLKLYDKI